MSVRWRPRPLPITAYCARRQPKHLANLGVGHPGEEAHLDDSAQSWVGCLKSLKRIGDMRDVGVRSRDRVGQVRVQRNPNPSTASTLGRALAGKVDDDRT